MVALYKLYMRRDRNYKAKKLRQSYPYLNGIKISSNPELVVFHQLGNVAPKEKKEYIWTFDDQIIRFSFPVIYPRKSYRFSRTGIKTGGRFSSAETAQNYDYIAEKTLEDKKGKNDTQSGSSFSFKRSNDSKS